MKNKLLIFTLLVGLTISGFGQKVQLVYAPVTNTNLEEAFPLAFVLLQNELKVGIQEFNYSEKTLLSTYFEYYRGISKFRGQWFFKIDNTGTLEIEIINIDLWMTSENRWAAAGKGLFSKKEETLRAAIAEDIRNDIMIKEKVESSKNLFFTNLEVNRLFYETATDLAGDRWFDSYLKDKKVDWNLTFINIEKNDLAYSNYKYKEIFTNSINISLGEMTYEYNKFYITKFTNIDNNVLSSKGDRKNVQGFCRSLKYLDKKFYISLTENINDDLPQVKENNKKTEKPTDNSILEVAEQLKKLKELLDLGAITQAEYDQEKSKLLNK